MECRKVASGWRQDLFVGGVNNMKPNISMFRKMAVFGPQKMALPVLKSKF